MSLLRPVSSILALIFFVFAPITNAQWVNYRIPNMPRLASGQVNLSAPTPKAADGKPDLTGMWESEPGYFFDLAKDLKPEDVVMLPWAKEQQARNQADDHQNDTLGACMPAGVPRINMSVPGMPHPFKIVQTAKLIVLLYETSGNSTFRQVFLDGRPLPTDPQPTWLGYSVGHWDRDTLVVETIGFNGHSWIDTRQGHPQTEAGRVVERFTRRDFGHLEIEITIDDPKAYAKPWTAKVPVHLLPDTDLIETYCENEQDLKHRR